VAEHHPRDAGVLRASEPAEDRVDRDARLVLRQMGELTLPGDVADRPHARPGGAVVVDLDRTVLALADAQRLQPQVVGARTAPGRQHDDICGHHGAVAQHQHAVVAVAVCAYRGRFES
jgi:hypothetical protein